MEAAGILTTIYINLVPMPFPPLVNCILSHICILHARGGNGLGAMLIYGGKDIKLEMEKVKQKLK